MKKDEKVTIYRGKDKLEGFLRKTNGQVVVVEINGKTFVGRIVQQWIEL